MGSRLLCGSFTVMLTRISRSVLEVNTELHKRLSDKVVMMALDHVTKDYTKEKRIFWD